MLHTCLAACAVFNKHSPVSPAEEAADDRGDEGLQMLSGE